MKIKKKIVCFTPWMRFNNLRYESILPEIYIYMHVHKYQISKLKFIGGLHYYLWTFLKYKYFYPKYLRKFSQTYDILYTFQYDQIPFWPKEKEIILDLDDPVFSDKEIEFINYPNVKTLIVSTDYAKLKYESLGIKIPIVVIYQGVKGDMEYQVNPDVNQKVIIGYHAPTLSTSLDNPSLYRNGVDNLDLFVEALDLLDDTYKDKITVSLIGKASPSVLQLAKNNKFIKLEGLVASNEVMNYVNKFDIGLYPRTFILPSGRLSIKIVQYMMLGKPIIATKLSETEIVNNTLSGIICEDASDFSKALAELIDNKNMRDKFGNNGREFAKKYFLLETTINQYKSFFLNYLSIV
ncbi:hypothetical protein AR687_00620 [Flavobacteriaceae bacterium CRH]|nr:hypothetical protein AR687_00620 [Flavobacteriaceae bacterium CRH]